MPLQPVKMLELAAFASFDIVAVINRAWQYLKPLWFDRSFLLKGAGDQLPLEDAVPLAEAEEYGAFDRTLVAHCIAYNVRQTSNTTKNPLTVCSVIQQMYNMRLIGTLKMLLNSVFTLLQLHRNILFMNY
jgi:hypothetical protein